jgi:sirohydrochlorin cobaltochelatase
VSKEACYAYQIAEQVCPEIENKAILCMPFPMIRDEQKLELAHSRIYQAIEDSLRQGQKVGLLTIGDPSVYSTYLYMHRRAREAGWQAQIISGVPSFCAVAARLGISLGEKTDEIHIIPAAYEIEDTLSYRGTRIYMKSGRKLKELIEALRADAHTADCEIYGVSNCGMENERVYRGLEELADAEGYLTTVIIKPRI